MTWNRTISLSDKPEVLRTVNVTKKSRSKGPGVVVNVRVAGSNRACAGNGLVENVSALGGVLGSVAEIVNVVVPISGASRSPIRARIGGWIEPAGGGLTVIYTGCDVPRICRGNLALASSTYGPAGTSCQVAVKGLVVAIPTLTGLEAS